MAENRHPGDFVGWQLNMKHYVEQLYSSPEICVLLHMKAGLGVNGWTVLYINIYPDCCMFVF